VELVPEPEQELVAVQVVLEPAPAPAQVVVLELARELVVQALVAEVLAQQEILYKNFGKQLFQTVCTGGDDILMDVIPFLRKTKKTIIMKYFLYVTALMLTLLACNNPDQNSAAGNEADIRDSSTRNNPNSNVADSTQNDISADSSHHH
jgi:hypothetical protein